MKLFKGLILTIVVVSIGFVGAKAQTWYPDDCSISAPDVVIPWNQSSITGYINVTYWNYSQPYRGAMHSAYFNSVPLSWQGDYPTQFTFTVSAPGDYKAEVYFYSEIYTPTVRYRTCNVHVTKQHQVTVQNSFAGGLVNVGDTQTRPQYPSGTPFYWIGGTTHTLEAFNQDFQAPGEQNYFRVYGNWTRSSDINWSTSTNPYTMTASQTETYTANFKKQFNMALSAGSYDGASGGTYTVNGANVGATYNWTRLQDQSDNIGAVSPSNMFFAYWDDGNTSNPRTLAPIDHTTRYALYKGVHLSNASTAFTNNSQRKFVRTTDGILHLVYESMGRVWYERSTDNGATWTLANGGRPLSDLDSKNPSIDNYFGVPGIAYQERNGGMYKIRFAYFYSDGSKFGDYVVDDQSGFVFPDLYSNNANPVVARGPSGQLVVVWQRNTGTAESGLCYRYGTVSYFYWGVTWYTTPRFVPTSDINSKNPTIVGFKSGSAPVFHLAWDQSRTSIQYCKLTESNYDIVFSNSATIGYGSGYAYLYNPVIAVNPTNSNDYRIAFYGENPGSDRRAVTYFTSMNTYFTYGTWAASVSINATDDGGDGASIIGWTDYSSTGPGRFAILTNWYTFTRYLNKNGEVQLNNGTSRTTTYGMAYNKSALPYYFDMSGSISSFNKASSSQISSGREAVIAKDGAQYYCVLGDITLNGKPVEFTDYEKDYRTNGISDINKHLVTKPFALHDESSLTFNVVYGTTDSLLAARELGDKEHVRFRIELLNDADNKVIGELTNVSLSKENVVNRQVESYSIDAKGIRNKTVRLRLITDTDVDCIGGLSNIYADRVVLSKQDAAHEVTTISYQGTLAVKEYGLAQNYPNPFNPSTVINYQLPLTSHVSLKVFDILGREVAALVDGQMEAGYHTATFDASHLASGLYFARLNVVSSSGKSFIETIKMLLTK